MTGLSVVVDGEADYICSRLNPVIETEYLATEAPSILHIGVKIMAKKIRIQSGPYPKFSPTIPD